MRLLRECLVGLLVLLTALSSSVHAQSRHVVRPVDIAAAIDAHVASQSADRAAVREALERPEVRDMATRIGIDLDHVTASIGTLSGPDLVSMATAARQVNETFVGGSGSVTLSTTTIIIVLLALILIIVAVK
jgi:preprotein translocase subunit SecF